VPPTDAAGTLSAEQIYGDTKSGRPITEELIEHLADEAERSYDADEFLASRGKPGRFASTVT